MKTNNSCYNCKNRVIGCHSNCETYKEYKSHLDKIKHKKQAEKLKYASHKRRSKVYG